MEAVLDAAGSERAALFGISEGGPTSVLMAAMRPQRITSLILYGTFASGRPPRPSTFRPSTIERAELPELLEADRALGRCEQVHGGLRSECDSDRVAEARVRDVRAGGGKPAHGSGACRDLDADRHPRRPAVGERADARAARRRATALSRWRPANSSRTASPGPASSRCRALTMPSGSLDGLVDEIERFVTGAVHRSRAEPGVGERPVHGHRRLDHARGGAGRPRLARGARATRRARRPHRLRARRPGRQAHRRRGAVGVRRAGDGDALRRGAARGRRELGIQLRSGIHTGECEAIGEDLGGLAVHIGARVGALAGPGEIVVSSTVKELVVGSDMQFTDRGEHELKGVPGSWHIYALGEERTPRLSSTGRRNTCAAQTALPSRSRVGCPGPCASLDSWRPAPLREGRRRSDHTSAALRSGEVRASLPSVARAGTTPSPRRSRS